MVGRRGGNCKGSASEVDVGLTPGAHATQYSTDEGLAPKCLLHFLETSCCAQLLCLSNLRYVIGLRFMRFMRNVILAFSCAKLQMRDIACRCE